MYFSNPSLKTNKKIVPNFKPTYNASDLSIYCEKPTPLAQYKFLVKHASPFFELAENYKYMMNNKYQQNKCLRNIKQTQVKHVDCELEKMLEGGSLKFCDDQIVKSVCQRLAEKHDSFHLNKIKIQLKRQVSLKRGRKIEKNMRDHLNEVSHFHFKSSSDFHTKDYGEFKITGAFDGIDEKNSTILEIKSLNRTSLESFLPSRRQRIQMLVYMDIYACTKCLFLCAKSNGDVVFKEIVWNEHEFKSLVKDKLVEFTKRMREMTERDFINLMILCRI